MNPKLLALAAAALTAGAAAPALAHHSFAMFDNQKEVQLVGTVKEFQWTNPHTWIQVVVPDAAGTSTSEWSVEGGNPGDLARRGWKKTSLKPGDKVTVRIHPMKNGSNGGSLVGVTLADGTVVGR
jgi:hypothetical protein